MPIFIFLILLSALFGDQILFFSVIDIIFIMMLYIAYVYHVIIMFSYVRKTKKRFDKFLRSFAVYVLLSNHSMFSLHE